MDKRWIAILIIIIIAGGCIYLIAQYSPTVGSAIADVDKSSITLPYGFSAGESNGASLEIHDKNTGESVLVTDLGKGNTSKESFDNDLKELKKSNCKIIDTPTVADNGIDIYIAHYANLNGKNPKNESIAYYYTYSHTYNLKLTGFDNFGRMDEIIKFIAETTQPDYKKSQDSDDNQGQSDLAVKYEKKVKSQE